MKFIKTKGLSHKYNIKDKDGNKVGENWAIDGVDFEADRGQIIAVLGRNGSGKSTFARHLNGLLRADRGTVFVDGKSPAKDEELFQVRKNVGMVFQNPDNQIVGSTLLEDVAFGLENVGCPSDEIRARAAEMLEFTGLSLYGERGTGHISGGQKQRLAIASAMAMEPGCIVLDEATSMLDPQGAIDMMELVRRINREKGVTVIMVTHKVEEALLADRVYILDEGRVISEGESESVLGDAEKLMEYGLDVPIRMKLKSGIPVDITFDYKKSVRGAAAQKEAAVSDVKSESGVDAERVVKLENVSYAYKNGNESTPALRSVNMDIQRGQVVSVIGHTGSGKSTLLQMFNRLLTPDEGTVSLYGEDIGKVKNLKSVRKKIGYVFQFPESQLFESTVLKDVMYGPVNFGESRKNAEQQARTALEMTGIPEKYYEYSPFELSGGMMKRVALAGILAYEPEILILDEPACGLDGESRRQLFDIIRRLNREKGCTVIFVSHDMEDVFELTERVVMLDEGRIVYDGGTEEFFDDDELLERYHIVKPDGALLYGDIIQTNYI